MRWSLYKETLGTCGMRTRPLSRRLSRPAAIYCKLTAGRENCGLAASRP